MESTINVPSSVPTAPFRYEGKRLMRIECGVGNLCLFLFLWTSSFWVERRVNVMQTNNELSRDSLHES